MAASRTTSGHPDDNTAETPDAGGAESRRHATATEVLTLKGALESLQDERDRAQRYLDTAEVILLALDLDGRITLANRYVCGLLGWAPAELVGRDWIESCVPARSRDAMRGKLQKLLAGDLGVVESPVLQRSGEERIIEWHNTLLRDDAGHVVGTFSSGIDITEQHHAIQALRIAEERMRFALETAGVGIWDMDYKTGTNRWSTVIEAQYGFQPGTFGGTFESFVGRIHPADREAALEVIGTATKSGSHFSLLNRSQWPDGTVRWLRSAGHVYLDERGEPLRAIGISQDVTDHHAVEEQYLQAQQMEKLMLQERNEALERATQAKSDFLSSMSHELRSPLNAILGFAQLMAMDPATIAPAHKASVDQILEAGWYLLKLINDILDTAQIESGKLSVSPEHVSLSEVLVECQTLIEPLRHQHGIGLSFPTFDRPCFVGADRTRLKQVIVNLLSNAIKYNRQRGTVAVEYATTASGRVRISVRDTGNGLTGEQQAQLFQPFNRLGREAGTEQGTGLGLVVSKGLIELMQGAIGVDSTVGVGSVFWIELPATAAPLLDLDSSPSAAGAHPQAPTDAPVRTVLYVEDNPANLALVEQLVARSPDLILLSARDGRLGLKVAREARPDVILMDINLPELNGLEAMKILRQDPTTAHIPVVALSANAMPRDVRKGLDAGFFQYLTKPIKVDELMGTLRGALEWANQRLEPRQ